MASLGLPSSLSTSERSLPRQGHGPDVDRRWATDLTTVWTSRTASSPSSPSSLGDRVLLACDAQERRAAPSSPPSTRPARRLRRRSPRSRRLRAPLRPRPAYGGDAESSAACGRWIHVRPGGATDRQCGGRRVILTLKTDWSGLVSGTRRRLRAAIIAWMLTYNAERPHHALTWATPNERRAQNLSDRTIAA